MKEKITYEVEGVSRTEYFLKFNPAYKQLLHTHRSDNLRNLPLPQKSQGVGKVERVNSKGNLYKPLAFSYNKMGNFSFPNKEEIINSLKTVKTVNSINSVKSNNLSNGKEQTDSPATHSRVLTESSPFSETDPNSPENIEVIK